MSISEIKQEVHHLSPAELDELAACVRMARKRGDRDWLERVASINANMDAQGGHSEEELRNLHERLNAEGR